MDPFLGEIRILPLDWAPRGWALCDGRILQINQNEALFSLLGTYFGGDGVKTFALPNLQGAAVVGVGKGHKSPQFAEMVEHQLGEVKAHAAAYTPSGSAAGYAGASAETGEATEKALPFLALNYFIALNGIYPMRD